VRAEEGAEEEEERRRSRDTESKTRTPHKDVGKHVIFHSYVI